ncbi:MAG: ribonuclease J [Chloroflexi bacterium]|nr:ribonuclease J [Chloroflexota bacterium]
MPRKAINVIPLGGVGEVGKNSNLVQYGKTMLLVDAGVKFPEEEMHGVDLVIPDFTYVQENADQLQALLLTHGHEDHIGAVPYLLRTLGRRLPICGSPLTLGLVEARLREHRLTHLADLCPIGPGATLRFGPLEVEFIAVTHSIPDARSIVIRSPIGTVLFTGDFKFDESPVAGTPSDIPRLRALGDEGVLALFSDCVRVAQPGRTPSESVVRKTLERVIGEAQGRVIFTSFASNITRLEMAVDIGRRNGRKAAVVGRSLQDNLAVAQELGYFTPDGALVDLAQIRGLSANQVLLLVTGSQGEPSSALARIAAGDHPQVKIVPGDTVVFSATPVPGNEETVSRTIDNLFRRDAVVVYQDVVENVHVSGHASRDELKEMIDLARPRFCAPIHGEYRHMVQYRTMAQEMGIPSERIVLSDIGDIVELSPEMARIKGGVQSGSVLVDGLALGVPRALLRERGRLAEDGILIAAIAIDRETGRLLGGPDLFTRGLAIPAEADVLGRARTELLRALKRYPRAEVEYGFIVTKIKEVLGKFIYQTTKLQPLILPVVTEV